MRAKRTEREYRIFISVPTAPPPAEGYPVLYALDGNASFGSLAEAMRLQSRPPHGFAPSIVVGIGYPSDEPIVTDRRFYDYTVPVAGEQLPPRPNGAEWPETGGAEAFLAFIEEELKPAVEQALPVNRSRQTLFGHSLGGFFALYVLAERPDAFAAYAAGSPSIWWNGGKLLERIPRMLEQRSEAASPIALFIGIGSEEKPQMTGDAEQMYKLLQPYEGEGFRLAYRSFEGEGHISVIPPMISRMLRFISSGEGNNVSARSS
jgi:predicted alpha/beta superfamily hydrolase